MIALSTFSFDLTFGLLTLGANATPRWDSQSLFSLTSIENMLEGTSSFRISKNELICSNNCNCVRISSSFS